VDLLKNYIMGDKGGYQDKLRFARVLHAGKLEARMGMEDRWTVSDSIEELFGQYHVYPGEHNA